jgi:hypothetical protein
MLRPSQVIRGGANASNSPHAARPSTDRPTEPAAASLPVVPIIPRAARVPVFPEEWLEHPEAMHEPSLERTGTHPSFSPAPVLRQSYATLCERAGRQRLPA